MRIVGHNKFGKPFDVEATRVVVYDDLGNPMMLGLDPGGGVLVAAIADDDPTRAAEFHRLLRSFGVDKTVIVSSLTPTPLNQMNFNRR